MNRQVLDVWLAVLGLLAGCSAGTEGVPPAAASESATDTGARLYEANCTACHQPDGRGLEGVYPSLSLSPVVLGDPSALALWVVRSRRPEAMPAGRYATAMPQFGWMKPDAAAALFTHLRSHFGNDAPAVDAAAVARALDAAR